MLNNNGRRRRRRRRSAPRHDLNLINPVAFPNATSVAQAAHYAVASHLDCASAGASGSKEEQCLLSFGCRLSSKFDVDEQAFDFLIGSNDFLDTKDKKLMRRGYSEGKDCSKYVCKL